MKVTAQTLAQVRRLAGQLAAAAGEPGLPWPPPPAPAGFSLRISYPRNPATTWAQTRAATTENGLRRGAGLGGNGLSADGFSRRYS